MNTPKLLLIILCAGALISFSPRGTGEARADAETPASSGPASMVDEPVFRIPMTREAPHIDGVMESGEWADSSALSGFWYDRHHGNFLFLAAPETQLEVYGAYDRENLYIAYTSPVWPEGAWLKAWGKFPDVTHHPQYGLIWDDHIEFDIRPYPDNTRGYELGIFKWFVNPLGLTADLYWSPETGGLHRWHSGAAIGTRVTDKRWVVEMKVPLESFRYESYSGTAGDGKPLVPIPPHPESTYRIWCARGIGGTRSFFNAYDAHQWNMTRTRMILDPDTVSFQINRLGPIMEDVVDLDLTVKNHGTRSRTVKLGFFVENPEETIYSSYEDEELKDGFLELRPGEERRLNLRKEMPGVDLNGNVLWFDVRQAGDPAKPVYRTRLINFHHMNGGQFEHRDGSVTSFRWERVDVLKRMRPMKRTFGFEYAYSRYKNRFHAIVDKAVEGAEEKIRRARTARLIVSTATDEEQVVKSVTEPFRGDYATFLVGLPELQPGKYRLAVLLFDENLRLLGDRTTDAFTVKDYPWMRNGMGKDDVVWWPFEPMEITDGGFKTLKHSFTVGENGLPEQIRIKPDKRDLPLELRENDEDIDEQLLVTLGRGPQLSSPMRIEAVIDGRRVRAEVLNEAELVRKWKSELEYRSRLRLGPLDATIEVRYDADGAMTCDMEYNSCETASIDRLQLVAEFRGGFQFAASSKAGKNATLSGAVIPEVKLGPGPGVVWDSTGPDRSPLYYSTMVPILTFGNGDRGFTWISDSDRGWVLDRDGSTLQLIRRNNDSLRMEVSFVNHTSVVDDEKRRLRFMLLTHPAKPKPAQYRRIAYFREHFCFGEARAMRFRGQMPAIPATLDNALTGDLTGVTERPPERIRRKEIVNGEEKWVTREAGGIFANMNRVWADWAVLNLWQEAREENLTGWWWKETWPPGFVNNMALGNGSFRDPQEIREGELP
ncbi:MAG: hypothetical protein R6V03_02135 [Kiritimatiellia bacterium]